MLDTASIDEASRHKINALHMVFAYAVILLLGCLARGGRGRHDGKPALVIGAGARLRAREFARCATARDHGAMGNRAGHEPQEHCGQVQQREYLRVHIVTNFLEVILTTNQPKRPRSQGLPLQFK